MNSFILPKRYSYGKGVLGKFNLYAETKYFSYETYSEDIYKSMNLTSNQVIYMVKILKIN